MIYDGWHTYSQVTIDHRDGRDQVDMRKDQFMQKLGYLKTPDSVVIEEFHSKRNRDMVRSTRHIATKTFREMKDIIRTKWNINVSLGSITNFKPYYVQTATEREKVSANSV